MKINKIKEIIEKKHFEIFDEKTEKVLIVHRNHRKCGEIFKKFGECKITDCDIDFGIIRIFINTERK